MRFSWLLLLSAHSFAAEDPCKNAKAFDRFVGSLDNSFAAPCVRGRTEMEQIWNNFTIKARDLKMQRARSGGPDTQANAFNRTAEISASGSATKAKAAQVSEEARKGFVLVEAQAEKAAKYIRSKSVEAIQAGKFSGPRLTDFKNASLGAIQDYRLLQEDAHNRALAASQLAGEFQTDSTNLGKYADQSKKTAKRLEGGSSIDPNLLVGLGGAALITAGGIGGLYWVSQEAIKSANKDMEARIDQANKAAEERIKQAEEAAKRIIVLATGSANQIIANADEAMNRLYDRAKADGTALLTAVHNEIQQDFAVLTDQGIEKFQAELMAIIDKAIAKAKAEGNALAALALEKVKAGIIADIAAEKQKRLGTNSTTTASATASSTSTSSSTSTASATSTSTSSSTSSATSTQTATNTSTSTDTNSYYRE